MPPVVALPSCAGKRREQVGFAPVVVEGKLRGDAVVGEVVAHPVDQGQVRIAAGRVEADQRANQVQADRVPGLRWLAAAGDVHVGAFHAGEVTFRTDIARATVKACETGRDAVNRLSLAATLTRCTTSKRMIDGTMLRDAVLALLLARAADRDARSPHAQTLPLDKIKLPPGFTIELVARVPNARAMTWGTQGHAVRRIDAAPARSTR